MVIPVRKGAVFSILDPLIGRAAHHCFPPERERKTPGPVEWDEYNWKFSPLHTVDGLNGNRITVYWGGQVGRPVAGRHHGFQIKIKTVQSPLVFSVTAELLSFFQKIPNVDESQLIFIVVSFSQRPQQCCPFANLPKHLTGILFLGKFLQFFNLREKCSCLWRKSSVERR